MSMPSGILEGCITAVRSFVEVHSVPPWRQAFRFDSKQDSSMCCGDGDLPNHDTIGTLEAAATGCRHRLTVTNGSQQEGGHYCK